MKLKTWIYLVSLLTALGLYLLGIYQREIWTDLLDGEPLPYITEFSLNYGFNLPFICMGILAFKNELVKTVITMESACVAVVLFGYYSPYLSITNNM